VLWRQRKTQEALKEWRAAYAATPDSFEVLYTLGSALSLDASSKPEAETLLRKAVAMRPGNAAANYQLAKLVWQQSRNPEALPFLQRATQADPEFRAAFYLLATVQQSLGRKADAAQSFARVKELSAKELGRQQDLFSELP
jgi:predicted Zn-dependent protease